MADEWVRITLREWQEVATKRFGKDPNKWLFVCPSCGQVQSRQNFLDIGMPLRQVDMIVGFSCIGRWQKANFRNVVGYCESTQGYGCMYAGGGNINISPYTVLLTKGCERPTFGFAP